MIHLILFYLFYLVLIVFAYSSMKSHVEFQEAHKLLQPADKAFKELAVEFAEYQVDLEYFCLWFRHYFYVWLRLLVDFSCELIWWLAWYGSVKYNYFFMLQVCVDVFVTTQTYVDIASISVIPRTTGGQVNVNYYGSVVEVNDWSISLVGFYLKWIDQIFAVRMNK